MNRRELIWGLAASAAAGAVVASCSLAMVQATRPLEPEYVPGRMVLNRDDQARWLIGYEHDGKVVWRPVQWDSRALTDRAVRQRAHGI